MKVNLKPVQQQVIVITGASSGIGLATAQEAVRRGAAVVLAARNQEVLERIAQELRDWGGRVAIFAIDIAAEGAVEGIADTADRAFGGFDTWVNCAAVTVYGEMTELDLAEHRRVLEVNYFGMLRGMIIAARRLRRRGGAIINVGSILSDRTLIMQGPYCASKHAVRSATDALRMELERRGYPISVTLIKPGAMNTPLPEHARNYMDLPPRFPQIVYDPRLVADAVLFAAEHPRRDIYVGGHGYLISLTGTLFPRITDLVMEIAMVRGQQTRSAPGDPSVRDNLFETRSRGDVHSHQDIAMRRQSLALEVQKKPMVAAAAGAVAGLLVWAITARRSASALRHAACSCPSKNADKGGG